MWQRELCRECEAPRCQGAETREPATLFKEMLVRGFEGRGGGGWLLPTALFVLSRVLCFGGPIRFNGVAHPAHTAEMLCGLSGVTSHQRLCD